MSSRAASARTGSARLTVQSKDAEDEGSFEFACEIVSRIVSTRVNKFLMNMYKWLLTRLDGEGGPGDLRKSAVFLGKSYT